MAELAVAVKLGIKDDHLIMPKATDTGLEPPPKKTKTLFNFMAKNTVEIDRDSTETSISTWLLCVYLSAPTQPTSGMRMVKNIHHLQQSLKKF